MMEAVSPAPRMTEIDDGNREYAHAFRQSPQDQKRQGR